MQIVWGADEERKGDTQRHRQRDIKTREVRKGEENWKRRYRYRREDNKETK